MPSLELRSLAATVALAVTVFGARAAAQCTQPAQATAVENSVKRAKSCNDRFLSDGPGASCTPLAPPPCAGSVVGDAIALGYGPNNPAAAAIHTGALAAQYACQKKISQAITTYVSVKLAGLIANVPPATLEAQARVELDRIPNKCALTVAQDASGVVVPAVGPQCAAAVGAPSTTVDAGALRDCLHTLLQVWVDRAGPSPQALRPNIIVILSDDQRWDTTGRQHSPDRAVMPRTRAELARAGIEFTNGFMTTPLCCPSRASLLTGQYAHRTGVYSNNGLNGGADDFDDSSTMGTWMQEAGYRTGFVGKYLNGYPDLWTPPTPPYVPPGWDEWHAFPGAKYFDYLLVRNGDGFDHVQQHFGSREQDYSTDVLREIARDFITDSVQAGERFFLYFAPKAPHGPEEPAPRHAGMFAGLPPWRPASWNEADVSDKPSWVQETPPLTAQQRDEIDRFRRSQLEMLQALDEAIGGSAAHGITGLVETLRDLGVLENTFIVYLADNGYMWGEHRQYKKGKPYEEAIRSVMMVRYPRLVPLPRVEGRFALNIDIGPTILELAGLAPPIVQDGVSLVRLLDGTAPAWRTDFMTEGWAPGHEWASVRETRWKYTELPVTPGDPNTTFERELYDLVSDPLELQNAASNPAHAARIATMAARLRVIRPTWPLDSAGDVEDEDD